jgi:hypothetical protein
MRLLVSMFAMLTLAACGNDGPPQIDRIEMRRSGWASEDVTITSAGTGRYLVFDPNHTSEARSGRLQMTHKQFAEFLESLEPYRAEAERYSYGSAMRYIRGTCPNGVTQASDMGAMYIRWIGPKDDMHFLMDFGCDPVRNTDRNRRMHQAFEQLLLPRP